MVHDREVVERSYRGFAPYKNTCVGAGALDTTRLTNQPRDDARVIESSTIQTCGGNGRPWLLIALGPIQKYRLNAIESRSHSSASGIDEKSLDCRVEFVSPRLRGAEIAECSSRKASRFRWPRPQWPPFMRGGVEFKMLSRSALIILATIRAARSRVAAQEYSHANAQWRSFQDLRPFAHACSQGNSGVTDDQI